MNRTFKEQHLFDIEIFSNIINAFTVTSLMHTCWIKSINFFWKKHADPKMETCHKPWITFIDAI